MKNKNLIGSVIAMFLCVAIGIAGDLETKYATDTGVGGAASVALTFAPGYGKSVVKAVYAASDKQDSAVKLYARTGNKLAVSAVSADALTCTVVNANAQLDTGDLVVYVYNSGATPAYTTIAGTGTTYVILSDALTATTSTSDKLYEISQKGQIIVGLFGTGVGTNDTLVTSGDVYASPGDSPLYITLDGTSNAVLQATVEK